MAVGRLHAAVGLERSGRGVHEWLQIFAQTLGKPSWWALHGAPAGPPLRLSAFALALASCDRAGLLLAPIHVPGLGYHTSRPQR